MPDKESLRRSWRQVITAVAGFGTRLLPISIAIPEEMVPVVDRSLIQHLVDEVLASGPNEVVRIIRSGESVGEVHFDTHFEFEARLEAKGKQALLDELRPIAPLELRWCVTRRHQALAWGLPCTVPLTGSKQASRSGRSCAMYGSCLGPAS
ncbi:sugar phosphate nucleotidyltransferase [Halomonas maura]|uniref:sugar phosphate nucleotidyltransferase n=1 Tax=Halomonas maura TaxID=117606 RepID=UPI0025B31663|nr:sugar phosphate nucleotidyltransferase [Halomonas maura]MDN3555261.1 sugar phosphate nucleotidyltransferase [Halomonas maura]